MPHDVAAVSSTIHFSPELMTEDECFLVREVRAFKHVYPNHVLFGRRVAALVGRKWDESFQLALKSLVERRWLTHTDGGGYFANVWMLSQLHAAAGIEPFADRRFTVR
jgi:hypothetical protein